MWLILRARFGMRVKNRSGKRDFKYAGGRGGARLRVFEGFGCGNREV